MDSLDVAADAWERGDLAGAFWRFAQLAHAGDSIAQSNLAYFYGAGLHVRKNRRREEHWLRSAAGLGNAGALTSLAINARAKRRFAQAEALLLRAYNLGEGDAAVRLAVRALELGNDSAASRYCGNALSHFVLNDSETEELERLSNLAESRSTWHR
jgi:TPR repeat protein